MFPNAKDAPAKFAQLTVHAVVAGLVRGEFLFPECTVTSRNFVMLRAAMPETAVHKECQAVPPKKKIRSPENLLIPPPSGDAVLAKKIDHSNFCMLVATSPDSGHDSRAFSVGKNI